MAIWDESLKITLPYTNTAGCYEQLKRYPEIEQAFHKSLVPLASKAGDIAERVAKMEAARQKALDDYLAGGHSLREVDTALNCCMADLYIGMFSTAAEHIQKSDLSLAQKKDGIQVLRDAAAQGMSWNHTKQMELDMLLDGTGAEIELENE
jgi:hypothetical protein